MFCDRIIWRMAPAAFAATLFLAPAGAGPRAGESAPTAFRDAMSRERQGLRDPAFDAFHDRWMRRLPAPKDVLGVEPRLLAQAQKAIVSRAAIVGGPTPASLAGKSGIAPLAPFAALRASLRETFLRRLGLAAWIADSLAAEIERQSVETAGLDLSAYRAAPGLAGPGAATITAALRAATEQLWRDSRVDHARQTPYVAGYDRDDGARVFIDCAAPLKATRDGREIPVGPLLVLHERIEKAVLQDYRTLYPSAHQIALRLEKAAAQALGVDWKAYDDLIADLSEAISARKAPRDVSDRLDLQPYFTFPDAENRRLVAGMLKALTHDGGRAHPATGPQQPQGATCALDGTPTP